MESSKEFEGTTNRPPAVGKIIEFMAHNVHKRNWTLDNGDYRLPAQPVKRRKVWNQTENIYILMIVSKRYDSVLRELVDVTHFVRQVLDLDAIVRQKDLGWYKLCCSTVGCSWILRASIKPRLVLNSFIVSQFKQLM